MKLISDTKTRATKRISWLKWKFVKNIQWVANKGFMLRITPEITDEMTKNIKRREIQSKYLQQFVEKLNSATGSKTNVHSKHQE